MRATDKTGARPLTCAPRDSALAVSREHQVVTGSGTYRAVRPDLRWHRLSAGAGAHGHRWYDWALIDLHPTDPDHDQHRGRHARRVRRSTTTGALAFYRTWAPTPVPLATLVTVAGRRWTIEESVQAGKGLDRPGGAPDPPVELLATLDRPGDARPRSPGRPRRHHPAPDEPHTSRPATFELISLTCNVIQRLIAA